MSSKHTDRIGLAFSLKLSLLYALFFFMASVGLFIVAYYSIDYLLSRNERDIIQAQIQEYRAWFEEGGIDALSVRFDEQSSTDKNAFFVRITGTHNKALFVSIPKGSGSFDAQLLDRLGEHRAGTWVTIKDLGETNAWTIASAPLQDGLTIDVGKSSAHARAFLSYFRTVCIGFLVPMLLVGIAGGGLLTFRTMRPLRHLIGTVRDILRTREMSTRVPVEKGSGELNELVSLFNQMLDKNDTLIRAMHNSLDNVAHDLRTPMTRLRGMAELALRDTGNPEVVREALADCLEESERMLTMLNTLMDVAEAETGVMRLQKTDLAVGQVVEKVAEIYGLIAEDKNISLTIDVHADIHVQADATRLQQVLANLLDNALKYTGPGGAVAVRAESRDGRVAITVSDTGPGIASHEIDLIWNRLYRGDHSRSQRGLGLGLSLVQAIVHAHGGTASVESRPNKGSTFTITFPAAA